MPANRVLLDAGAMVALFNARDHWRDYFDERIEALNGAELVTTWPCVTEAAHLLRVLSNRISLVRWLAEGGAGVTEIPASALRSIAALMERYSDRRAMDLADGSLVWLAVAVGSHQILTVDRADFERYRLPGGKRFDIL